MKKSDTGDSTRAIREMHSKLSPLFPLELPFDSTGGKRELQPLRAHPVLNALAILASYLVAGIFVLFVHFNIGIWVSVPWAIALLWAFAMQRDMPPAPLNVTVKFWSDGSLCIKSDGASVYLNDVGPVWTQDGLVFALAHDYEQRLERGGNHAASILPALRARATKLGVGQLKPADFQSPHIDILPGEWAEGRDEMDAAFRQLCSSLLEQTRVMTAPAPILLGELVDTDDADTSKRNRKMLAAINVAACLHMHEHVEEQKKTEGKTPED